MDSPGADALRWWASARVEAPLLPLQRLRMRTVAGANSVGFLLCGSFCAFVFIGTLYMLQVLGYSALKTGLALLAASRRVVLDQP